MKIRFKWVNNDPLLKEYHDKEWGVPIHDDSLLFEFLVLESAQAGLSWNTILKKRENYRSSFDNFDPRKVAAYNDVKIEILRNDKGIVRNRLKINSAVSNAQTLQEIQREFGSFDKYIWKFVDGKPIQNRWKNIKELPLSTVVSGKMSIELKKRGFKFIGPKICYSFMLAVGMVNDHSVDCFRHSELQKSMKL